MVDFIAILKGTSGMIRVIGLILFTFVVLNFTVPASAVTKVDLLFTVTDVAEDQKDLLGEKFTGALEYDETFLTGYGDETLVSAHFSFEMTAFGQSFSGYDDVHFPAHPTFSFHNGVLSDADVLISEYGSNPTPIHEKGVGQIALFSPLYRNSAGVFEGEAIITAVPLSGSLPLVLLGVAVFGLVRVRAV